MPQPRPLEVAANALTLADRLADLVIRVGAKTRDERAGRLAGRAARLRAKADMLNADPLQWQKRDRLRRRAAALEARAGVLLAG